MSFSLPLAERDSVREQLERILASHFFRNSKRFPRFLRYTVENALRGTTEDIKERTLGIEVFGRQPDYDTSLDPVVRVTAAEVRKRLAQYYQVPDHKNETRIEYVLRSYVPEFSFPGVPSHSLRIDPAVQESARITATESRKGLASRWELIFAVMVSSIFVSAFVWWKLPLNQTAMDRFWSPVENVSTPVLLCISDSTGTLSPGADPRDPVNLAVAALPGWYRQNHVDFHDAMALATLASLLGGAGHSFHIRRSNNVALQDLQDGPVVLIGGLNNPWSVELDAELRFRFVRDGNLRYILDQKNPSSRQWSVLGTGHDVTAPVKEDYALISRVFDSNTGRVVFTAAGILGYGTMAASRCLADDSCLVKAESLAPGDWKHRNIQIVLGTTIIGDNPGMPQVLASYTW
jgi:hypothetical protein